MKKLNETVIILHALALNARWMRKLARTLEKQGYHVLNIDYPSRKHLIEDQAKIIYQQIKNQISDNQKLHFITHSMGGLVARKLIEYFKPAQIGRVVMLAPPNQGSEVADFAYRFSLLRFIFGPALEQLRINSHFIQSLPHHLNYDLGIITGDRYLDFISALFLIQGKNDGKVSVENSKHPAMRDHLVIHATHPFIPQNKLAIKQTLYFLEHSKFYPLS